MSTQAAMVFVLALAEGCYPRPRRLFPGGRVAVAAPSLQCYAGRSTPRGLDTKPLANVGTSGAYPSLSRSREHFVSCTALGQGTTSQDAIMQPITLAPFITR